MIIFWCPPGVCKHSSLFCLSFCNPLAHIRLLYIRWKGTSIALIWGIIACPNPRGYRDMAWGYDFVNPPSYVHIISYQAFLCLTRRFWQKAPVKICASAKEWLSGILLCMLVPKSLLDRFVHYYVDNRHRCTLTWYFSFTKLLATYSVRMSNQCGHSLTGMGSSG